MGITFEILEKDVCLETDVFFGWRKDLQLQIYPFVIKDGGVEIGFIKIYSALHSQSGYWHTHELGNFGVDLYLTHLDDQNPEQVKLVFDVFLKGLFKPQNLHDVTERPYGEAINQIPIFFGADYRIEELMMMKDGGALLLEVYWI